MNFFNKKTQKLVAGIVLAVIAGMVLTTVIPYLL